MCTCGIPNKANVHYHLVIGRYIPGGTETSDVDLYVCTTHDNGDDTYVSHNMLHPDILAGGWTILEHTRTELR